MSHPYNPAARLIVSRTPVDAAAQILTASASRRYMRDAGLKPVATRYFLFVPESVHRQAPAIETALTWLPLGGQYAAFGRKT